MFWDQALHPEDGQEMMMPLTQARLRQLLLYTPETGEWVWLVSRGNAAKGSLAGSVGERGYRYIGLDGHRHRSSRLAFLYMTGSVPELVDHINRQRDDDRWVNLRSVTKSCNSQNRSQQSNNSSGFAGVSFHKASKKWRATIRARGALRHLGLFLTAEEASSAYQAAKAELHIETPAIGAR